MAAGRRGRGSRRGSGANAAAASRMQNATYAEAACACDGSHDSIINTPLPSVEAILAAVESLYDDELRPYGRLLRKRLTESVGDSAPSISDLNLHSLCATISCLSIESGNGGEWCALLKGRRSDVADVYNSTDTFPKAFWEAFEAFFASSSGAGVELPGGRYLCAQALLTMELPFLADYSLGKVSHVVQLAITQKKLLGYREGSVVPYATSTCRVKELRAQQLQACGIRGPASETVALSIADWETARTCVHAILQTGLDRGDGHVPLSNIKRLFRSVHSLELSETALGHTRLSELLQDQRFHNICTVELQPRGYAVLPVFESGAPLGPLSSIASCTMDGPQYDDFPSRESSSSSLSENLGAHGMVRCTFINAAPIPPTPLRTSAARAQSVPRDSHLCQNVLSLGKEMKAYKQLSLAELLAPAVSEALVSARSVEESCSSSTQGSRFCMVEPSCIEDECEPRPQPTFCQDEPLCLDDAEEISTAFLMTPTPFPLMTPPPFAPRLQAKFCLGEPLCLDDADASAVLSGFAVTTPTPVITSAFSRRTPSPCLCPWALSRIDQGFDRHQIDPLCVEPRLWSLLGCAH